MEEKIYYPAVFFADIVQYYGGSETHIEELMSNNIARARANVLIELKNSIEDLQRVDVKEKHSDASNMGAGILEDLSKIKDGEKEQKKIKKIEQITSKVKTMTKIDGEISDKLLLKIQLLSEKTGITGYSDTNIIRFMDKRQDALKEEKYHEIISFLIEPEVQGDYRDLCERLLECISNPKYAEIPEDKRRLVEECLMRSDFSGKHILRIFRKLQECSIGFSNEERKNEQNSLNSKAEDSWEILGNITKSLQSIWGEIEAEGVGISHEEKEKISFDVAGDLLEDYKFYNDGIRYDIESSKGFQALIFYRLCNKIFYYRKNSKEEHDDIQKALAFFSFSILQRAIEHTEILIHPAADLGVPIFIGNKVMIGKQCKIESACILGNNVCLYPFNIYNRDFQSQDIYIHIEKNTILCRNVKVLGSINIGRECIINKSILIGDNIEDKKYVDTNSIVDINNEMWQDKKLKVMGGTL